MATKKRKFNLNEEEFDFAREEVEEPIKEQHEEPNQNFMNQPVEETTVAKQTQTVQNAATVKTEEIIKEQTKEIAQEPPVEKRAETRGRKKKETPTETDMITVNIAGQRHDLDLLGRKYAMEHGLKRISMSAFVSAICEAEIERNKDYLEKARVILG